MKNKTKNQIITETWDEGNDKLKLILAKYRREIEDFAYTCMKKYQAERRKK